MSFIYALQATWNNAGTTFVGIGMNFTNGSGAAPVNAAASRAIQLTNSGSSFFSVDVSGNTYILGNARIGSASFGNALLHVGANASVLSNDPAILIARNVIDVGHGLTDNTQLTGAGVTGYASIDILQNWTGSFSPDHGVSIQSFPVSGIAGTMTNYWGMLHAVEVDTGTLTNNIGIEIRDGTGTGTIVNQIGLNIASLSKGTTTNWGIKVGSATPVYFGGFISIRGLLSAPTQTIMMGGYENQTMIMERGSAAATPGFALNIQAGGCTLASANAAGGSLNLKGGISTGTAGSKITFSTSQPGGAGTADNSLFQWSFMDGFGNWTIGGAGSLGTNASGVIGMAESVPPASTPAGIGQIYVQGGALKYRGAGGTITVLGVS